MLKKNNMAVIYKYFEQIWMRHHYDKQRGKLHVLSTSEYEFEMFNGQTHFDYSYNILCVKNQTKKKKSAKSPK
jgi:hypothetical protein